MNKTIGTLLTTASLALTPASALAGIEPLPGDPGYNPSIPTYKKPRLVEIRHHLLDGGKVQVILTEAYETHHFDHVTVYGPRGVENIATRCKDGFWFRLGHNPLPNTTSYLQVLVKTACGNQIEVKNPSLDWVPKFPPKMYLL